MLPDVLEFSKWLRRTSPGAVTFRHYANDLKLFFAWLGKDPPDVTVTDIDAYIEHCQQDLGHAVATVNRRLAAIRTFCDFLDVTTPDAPPNPVIPKRHFVKQGRRLPRDVEDTDLELLFDAVDSIRDRAMFLLMLRCGLRVGEVRNLSTSDLYLHPAPASLPRLWLHGKNGTQRVAYLSSQALDALQAWLDERPQIEDDAVFVSSRRQRISVRTIQDRLTRACRRAGVSISCHQLRHTFGRHLVEAGVPVAIIQALFGHARIRTTQGYLHISDTCVQANYEAAIREVEKRFAHNGGSRKGGKQ